MSKHVPVLINEVLSLLDFQEDDVFVDLTIGRAGHSTEALKLIKTGFLYGFDQDETAIIYSAAKLQLGGQNFKLFHSNFVEVENKLAEIGVTKVDKILLDLGVSSPQFDEASRGFSYRFDGPLDMRMDQNSLGLTARDIVNKWPLADLTKLFYSYAEHPESRRVAEGIVRAREEKYIASTFQLVEIIKSSLSHHALRKKGHPAKQFFQALRIAVNDELNNLERVLESALKLLAPNGRLAVISFHSLEDRIVKNIFKEKSTKAKGHPAIPDRDLPDAPFTLITRKVVLPTEDEVQANPRSQSAKLRVIMRRE